MSITKRLDAITGIPEEYRAARVPAPKAVKIELTGKCNYNCVFCSHSNDGADEMDRGFYERIVKELYDVGVKELGLFYIGESFLCSWLEEAISYAKRIGFDYVFLTTNGSIATPYRVDGCMKAGLDSLKFSLNWADEAQFSEIARVQPKMFNNVAKNVKEARQVRDDGGYRCGLYGSYIDYDGEQGDRIKAYIDDLRPYLDEVYALPLYPFNKDGVTNQSWKFVQGNRGRAANLRDPLPCWSVFTEGHITHDGRLSACCFSSGGRFSMGDLNEVRFMDAWNCLTFEALRAAHLSKDVTGTICEKCVAY